MPDATARAAADEPLTTVHAACPHDCPDTCAMRITVQGQRIVRVQGNPDHPTTAGVLCTKVARYAERTDHPERLTQPLKRVGAKGAGRFEPVGWDEALADIAARLQAIAARAPEAIVPYSYAGTMGLVQGGSMASRFFHRLGASLLDRTICAAAGSDAMRLTYGGSLGMRVEQFAASRLILIWGSNSIGSNLHFWRYAQEAKRAGAKLVCIDPRRTETADKCHTHLALRPGTDGALALGLMHALITRGGADEAYAQAHIEGWPELRALALQWPPERAAAVCGLTPEQITGLAQDLATTRPAAIRLNYGMQRVRGGGNAVRLVLLLPCVAGLWRDAAGGALLSSSGWSNPRVRAQWLERPDLLAGRTPRSINMSAIGEALAQPGGGSFGPRIEALIVYNSNPVAVAPGGGSVASGFAREDLFTVVLEHFLTDTADMADYVLPATTQLEHWDVHKSYGHTSVLLNQPAIAPRGQARSNCEIFRQLAARMGFDEPCFADSDEALARGAFDAQVDWALLARQGWQQLDVPDAPFAHGGFATPSGKVVACNAQVPLPQHTPNFECAEQAPALAARYPLAMISPPPRNFLNSTFVNVRSLRAIEGEPVLEIHPQDAAPRGVVDGAMVRIHNERGATWARAVVGARARPGVVNALGVWWKKLTPHHSNANALTHQGLTDLGGGATFYDCLVEVEPA